MNSSSSENDFGAASRTHFSRSKRAMCGNISPKLLTATACLLAAIGVIVLLFARPESTPIELLDVQPSEVSSVVDGYLNVPSTASHVYVRKTFGRPWYLFARFTVPEDELSRCPDDGNIHPRWKYKRAELKDEIFALTQSYEPVLPAWFDAANIKSGAAFIGAIANPSDVAWMFIDSDSSTIYVLRSPKSYTPR